MGEEECKDVVKALVEFVKRASKKNATAEEVQALPAIAEVLVKLWP